MPTGPRCADGFPDSMMQFRNDRDRSTSYFSDRSVAASYSILIPGMKFTCNGTITKVTVGGVMRSGNQRMKLKLRIWKENANKLGIYHRSGKEIVLALNNMCNERCMFQLMSEKQISVEPGDILGIELPPSEDADYELHSVPAPWLTNYIFKATNLPSTVDLCKRIDETKEKPLIMFEINRDSGIHCNYITLQAIVFKSNFITGGQTTPNSYDQSGPISCPALGSTSTSPPSAGFDGKPRLHTWPMHMWLVAFKMHSYSIMSNYFDIITF